MNAGPDLLETTVAAAAGATRRLTTKEKVKTLIGLSGATDDTLLDQLIDQVSDDVARYCGLSADTAGAFPTFGAETLRATWYALTGDRDDILLLPWRPSAAPTTVVENGVTLTNDTDYRLLPGGALQRVSGGCPSIWDPCFKVVVTLTAGWSLPTGVPPGVEARIIDQVKLAYQGRKRDHAIRSETIPNIHQASYAVPGGDSIGQSGLLVALESVLSPYYRDAL
ncbi:MAG: hypothetical protein FD144_2667 [Rhodospirillaceae bacterium]|nr:MAG: hypothetical protein FD144_2667 [Rhodospirillaceae bacterium]